MAEVVIFTDVSHTSGWGRGAGAYKVATERDLPESAPGKPPGLVGGRSRKNQKLLDGVKKAVEEAQA